MSERIAKVIARATKHSRRGAEYLIAQGCVRVDGKLINSPALNVSASNRLELNNQRIKFEAPSLKLYKYHKPQGVLVTHDDPHGRKTIFDLLPERFENMVTIGRLDSETEGLLLLTNDGDLKRTLELPKNNFRREYTALVKGIVDDHVVNEMSRGIEISRMRYKPIEVVVESYSKQYTWVRLTLTEGKNREIRNAFENFGMRVTRLIRDSYGPYTLGSLEVGTTEEIKNIALIRKHLHLQES